MTQLGDFITHEDDAYKGLRVLEARIANRMAELSGRRDGFESLRTQVRNLMSLVSSDCIDPVTGDDLLAEMGRVVESVRAILDADDLLKGKVGSA